MIRIDGVWKWFSILLALLIALAGCTVGAPKGAAPTPQTGKDNTVGPAPREGPTTAGDIDTEHEKAAKAFPAKTEGVGAAELKPRLENGVKVFDLETKVVQWEVEPGVRREAWSYNGIVPGPMLRVTEGDRVRINLKNSLPESTSLHPHGMDMAGDDNKFDGVTYVNTPPTKPGQTFTYEFTATPWGTHMYHSHHDSTKQVSLGLLGPMIVDPKDKSKMVKADKEYVQVLNDGPLGYTINGKSFPATEPIVAKQGQKVLIRWMHEGALLHPMHLHGPRMTVVARDGVPLANPQQLDVLTISPGERWDVLIDTSKLGTWAWHCHVLPHAEGEKGLYGLTTAVIVQP